MDVRFGSISEIAVGLRYFRFCPENGHSSARSASLGHVVQWLGKPPRAPVRIKRSSTLSKDRAELSSKSAGPSSTAMTATRCRELYRAIFIAPHLSSHKILVQHAGPLNAFPVHRFPITISVPSRQPITWQDGRGITGLRMTALPPPEPCISILMSNQPLSDVRPRRWRHRRLSKSDFSSSGRAGKKWQITMELGMALLGGCCSPRTIQRQEWGASNVGPKKPLGPAKQSTSTCKQPLPSYDRGSCPPQ
jgi:hypothetical protein